MEQTKSSSHELYQKENSDDHIADRAAAVKVLGNPLILLKLLKSVRTRDLLHSCRLVNRVWRDFSTEILLKRTSFQIEFKCPAPMKILKATSRLTFKRLTELMSSGAGADDLPTLNTFPCAHFIFHGSLEWAVSQAFFSGFGSRVKGLKLFGAQNLKHVEKLLTEQIPHVESLELCQVVADINSNSNSSSSSSSRIFSQSQDSHSPAPQLSSLTLLKLGKGNSPELVKEILDAAPNLQEVFGIRSAEEIEWFQNQNNQQVHPGIGIGIVKGVELKVEPNWTRPTLLKLKSTLKNLQLHLTVLKLTFPDLSFFRLNLEERADFSRSLSQILEKSQKSLQQIKLAPDSEFVRQMTWPTKGKVGLRKVEKLTLVGDLAGNDSTSTPYPLLPLQSQISLLFPNLNTISLKNIQNNGQSGPTSFFENPLENPHYQIHTVKTLVISGPTQELLEIFLPLFPRVWRLSLDRVQGFSWLAPIIWEKATRLKSFQVNLFNSSSCEIDAGFTGLAEETCKRMLLNSRSGRKFWKEQSPQKLGPSILNLTELEQLFLPSGFEKVESLSKKSDNHPKWCNWPDCDKATFISFKYAFNLIPKLSVFPHHDH